MSATVIPGKSVAQWEAAEDGHTSSIIRRYQKNQRSSKSHPELSQLIECVPNKRARKANTSLSHVIKKQRKSRGTSSMIKRSFAVQFEDSEEATSCNRRHRDHRSPVRESTSDESLSSDNTGNSRNKSIEPRASGAAVLSSSPAVSPVIESVVIPDVRDESLQPPVESAESDTSLSDMEPFPMAQFLDTQSLDSSQPLQTEDGEHDDNEDGSMDRSVDDFPSDPQDDGHEEPRENEGDEHDTEDDGSGAPNDGQHDSDDSSEDDDDDDDDMNDDDKDEEEHDEEEHGEDEEEDVEEHGDDGPSSRPFPFGLRNLHLGAIS